MSIIARRVALCLVLACGTSFLPSLAIAQATVLSVSVTIGNGPPQSSEHVVEVGKEISLYSGPTYRIAAIPKEVTIAAVALELKVIPANPSTDKSVAPTTVEMSLPVGGDNKTIFGLDSPSQVHPQVTLSLRKK